MTVLALLATRSNSSLNIIGNATSSLDVHAASGLNWGYSSGTALIGDAYIPISLGNIQSCRKLFIKNNPTKVVWDDGTSMTLLAEQNSTGIGDGVQYGKALSTYGDKSELGTYLRKRIGNKIGKNLVHSQYVIETLSDIKSTYRGDKDAIINAIKNDSKLLSELEEKFITKQDLIKYGRDNIEITLCGNGAYLFNFHV